MAKRTRVKSFNSIEELDAWLLIANVSVRWIQRHGPVLDVCWDEDIPEDDPQTP